jgi:hypothetical protein
MAKELDGDAIVASSCWTLYSNCSQCWNKFAKESGRFQHLAMEQVRLDMALAKWLREHDARGARAQEYADRCRQFAEDNPSGGPAPSISDGANCFEQRCGKKKMRHLKSCFSCEHMGDGEEGAPLGELVGVQSFVDKFLVRSMENTKRLFARAVDVQTVLEHKLEWEQEAFGFEQLDKLYDFATRQPPWQTKRKWAGAKNCGSSPSFPGSIMHNGSHFLMFYHAAAGKLARAVSTDGLVWTSREPLQLDNGIKSTCAFDMCILHDKHETNEKYRYKMTYNSPGDRIATAFSSDSISWHAAVGGSKPWVHNSNTVFFGHGFGDTIPCLYHDKPDEYDFVARQQWPSPRYYTHTLYSHTMALP